MKLLTYAEAGWLVGDDAAQAIVDYAVALGRTSSADSIEFSALGPQGQTEMVTFLIGPATMMTIESTDSALDEPENSAAITTIRERLARIKPPAPVPSAERPNNQQIEDL
ncbi:hypothetical protein BH10ACT7_BH10ACT7_23490 [soil metagenome]